MRVMIVVHDLLPERAHLMPWRTVCEVAAAAPGHGVDARILSLGQASGALEGGLVPAGTRAIAKTTATWQRDLAAAVREFDPAMVFWPLSWREPAKRTGLLKRLGRPCVGYFSGGVPAVDQVIRAARRIGFQRAVPYLAEALAPKGRQLASFRAAGIDTVLTMTEFTARVVREQGWPADSVHAVPPGREANGVAAPEGGLPPAAAASINGDRYFLFMGPPGAIRGIHELLEAFDRLAATTAAIRLVCLFRPDATNQVDSQIRARLATLRHRDRVYVCWDSLDRPVVTAFMDQAYAIVLPFLLVPSEIPLTVLEAMSLGKPVISNDEGGTGDLVRTFGLTYRSGHVRGLAAAMRRLVLEPELHRAKTRTARDLAARHPTWAEVSGRWLNLASRTIG